MNGNDLLQYEMMLVHQKRLLDEADRLRLTREVSRRARRGRGATVTASASNRPVGAPRRRPTSVRALGPASGPASGRAPGHASERPSGHAPGVARRRFGGVAGRIGATLIAVGLRLQRLERGPDGSP